MPFKERLRKYLSQSDDLIESASTSYPVPWEPYQSEHGSSELGDYESAPAEQEHHQQDRREQERQEREFQEQERDRQKRERRERELHQRDGVNHTPDLGKEKEKGDELYIEGRFEEAISKYSQALGDDVSNKKSNSKLLMCRVQCYMKVKDLCLSVQVFGPH